MIQKRIQFFGQAATLACDAQCHKAWGMNGHRPKVFLSGPDHPDDYYYLPDHEVGFAPVDPGTTEGTDSKPLTTDERLNKWCARECERSWMSEPGQPDALIQLPNFDKRVYNSRIKQVEFDALVNEVGGE